MIQSIHNKLNKYINSESIFSIEKIEKEKFFNFFMNSLTKYHITRCENYKKICKELGFNKNFKEKNQEKLPFLPVNLFKSLDLLSVKKNKIIKIMNSSGTNSDTKSKIYIDKQNSINQIYVLKKIFLEITKYYHKVPMLVIDNKDEILKNKSFSARAAAVVGFSKFTINPFFILDEKNEIDTGRLKEFLNINNKKPYLIFGFTHLIWKYLLANKKISRINLNFSNATLIHGGGWKKLEKKKIDNFKFKNLLSRKFKIPTNKIINYYGMIEQTGSIFFECEKNDYFHVSKFSDIIIRDKNFKDIGFKKKGLIQLLSVIPTSYPGHNLLTEDLGIILGEDDCSCGKKGKYFKVLGRLNKSEIRGCSDAIS